MVEPNHLHRTYFETITEDRVYNLAYEFGLHGVGLDDAKSAVLVVGTRLYDALARKDQIYLSLSRCRRIAPMTGILSTILTIQSAKRFRCLFPCLLGVSRTYEFPPFGNGILG